MRNRLISNWLKIVLTIYLVIFFRVYWVELGPSNFLWFSDIALITITVALWLENSLLASAMCAGVLIFEIAWIIDFLARLLFNFGLLGPAGTSYMFNTELSLNLRLFSLSFHVILPFILLWAVHKLGYHTKAWLMQTILTWIVYPLCFWFTEPQRNINWTFGLGTAPQSWMPGYAWLILLMIFVPFFIIFPTHLLLKRIFPSSQSI